MQTLSGSAFVEGSDFARPWTEYGTCSVSLRHVDRHLLATCVTVFIHPPGLSFFFLFKQIFLDGLMS